jgi:hypothetical protein
MLLIILLGSILVCVGVHGFIVQSSFNIVFRYGYGPETHFKNVLNTFNGTFVKDLVNSSVATSLMLTQDELNQIRSMIRGVGFFSLNQSDMIEASNVTFRVFVSPLESYYLKVQDGTRTKELSWDRNIELNSKPVAPFANLTELIKEIVHSNPDFKKLPNPVGGYF